MLNRSQSIKLSDLSLIKSAAPGASLNDAFRLKKDGTIADIIECVKHIDEDTTINSLGKVVASRSFTRWCNNHKKVVAAAMIFLPGFSLALYGLRPGSFAMDLIANRATTNALGEVFSDINAMLHINDIAVPAMAAVSTPHVVPLAASSGSFFEGHGVILLHMLIVGFVTLIVSSFLKFTGRGDFIPLIAFVAGAAILYEVIGLFSDIYKATATLFNM